MIVIRFAGGLGNQMYQYALYKRMQKEGIKVLCDTKTFFESTKIDDGCDKREYELEEVFDVDIKKATAIHRWLVAILVKLKIMKIYQDKYEGFDSKVFKLNNCVLEGGWQSFKYSENIEELLRESFKMKSPYDEKSKKLLQEISECNSVSISVRRGDYVRLGRNLSFDYYKKAMLKIRSMVPDAKFYCVSDDIEWCKQNFEEDIVFVDWNDSKQKYFDMQVISNCKHSILANSTFCTWAAWMNANKGNVIYPRRWSDAYDEKKDYWPKEWLAEG